ncbi:outer membrane channel protein TolC [Vibrio sp. SCSIO 43137]|uniref:outer membrane channel protein TolC n=1 Tax=Vibrio sp. SCSIO 43137 TaxID=3021011 RepID=UPI002306E782|nr:outer membrane channel protein TolC [Vibrio sp. SCSIO 43137]WCE29294.1 outer membrane channel protein TolC [Vibrio sp. SCSIO 43137]
MKKLLPLIISMSLSSVATYSYADDLASIYNLAKENDPTLLRTAAERDAAFEAVNSSRSTLLPQINLTANYDINRSDTDSRESNQFAAGVSFTQELYKRSSWISLETAEKKARQSDANYAAEQQSLILRVSKAYFEVLRAQDNLEFVRAEKAAVARQLEQTKQRFEVGLSAITDVHDAQAQYDSVLASEVGSENNLTNSYEALREITGQEHTDLSILDTERFSTSKTKETPQQLLEQAQNENLSLLTARIAKDIAKDAISQADSGHLPTLTLDGRYGFTDQTQSAQDYDANDFNIGLNLAVPLYTGGNITSQVKQAEYNYVAASETLEASYRKVVTTVRSSNNNINATIGTIRAYEQSVISAKSALEATEAGFDVGTRTIVDVLDSTRRLYDANRNLSNARYNYVTNVLELRQAVGTLSEQDILDINAGLKAVN